MPLFIRTLIICVSTSGKFGSPSHEIRNLFTVSLIHPFNDTLTLLGAYFVLWAKNAAGRTIFSHSLWSIFHISYFYQFKMRYYSPWSFSFFFFLRCYEPLWLVNQPLDVVIVCCRLFLLPPKSHYCCCEAGALKTHGRSEWESDRWTFKKKNLTEYSGPLYGDSGGGGEVGVLKDPTDQVSSVTSIIMRAVLWSDFGEASLLSVCGGFPQMGVRLHRGALPPGFWCSHFKTLTPSDSPPQKVTSDMPCGGLTLGVKPASNSHLFGFIAAENLRRGGRGVGEWGRDNKDNKDAPVEHLCMVQKTL